MKYFYACLLLILPGTVLNACFEGCLKCDGFRGRCLFCDITSGFRLIRGRCEPVDIPNCAISNLEGECVVCDETHFLDRYTRKCLEIPEVGLIPHCSEYEADNICYLCEDGFFLNVMNQCLEIDTPIPNCDIYDTDLTCFRCAEDYLLNPETLAECQELPEITSCFSQTNIKCVSCKPGFKENKNNYIYSMMDNHKTHFRTLEKEFIKDKGNNYVDFFRINTCQKLQLPHCIDHENFKKCKKCEEDYFVNKESLCEIVPDEKILYCVEYSGPRTCIGCEERKFLKSETECVDVDGISQCSSYDHTASETVCLTCEDNFFLSEPNVCSDRSSFSEIKNCEELNPDSETCKVCNEGFIATSDFKKCLEIYENCEEYDNSSVASTELGCAYCRKGYYIDSTSKECVQGGVEHCETYEVFSNTCNKCRNRYFLYGAECKPHQDLVYCQEYSNEIENSCETCSDKTIKFDVVNKCQRVQFIEHCREFANETECQLCEDGYELDGNAFCIQIPGNEHCLKKEEDNCVKCLSQFILYDGNCVHPVDHMTKNCGEHNINGEIGFDEFECKYCRKNSLPIDFKDSFVCYSKKYIELHYDHLEDKCEQYYVVDGGLECNRCETNRVLIDGECEYSQDDFTIVRPEIVLVDQSGNGEMDSFLVSKKEHVIDGIPNCKIAAPNVNQDYTEIKYSCLKCSYAALVDFDNDDEISIFSHNPLNQDESTEELISPTVRLPGLTCLPEDPPLNFMRFRKSSESSSEWQIENCEYFYQVGIYGYGCLKCLRGFHGIVENIVFKCIAYSSPTDCSACEQGYHPTSPSQCSKVNSVNFCEQYENHTSDGLCQKCKNGYYLFSGPPSDPVCKAITKVPGCSEYSETEDLCDECKDNHTLDDGQCYPSIYMCETYEDRSSCSGCEAGYYLIENVCHLGSVDLCSEFLQNEPNTCVRCEGTAYLNPETNLCSSQPDDIEMCDSYLSEIGKCEVCSDGYLLFYQDTVCQSVEEIENCIKYHKIDLCFECEDGFIPANFGQRCLSIPEDLNCQKWGNLDNNECIECEVGHTNINGKCLEILQALLSDRVCYETFQTDNGIACKYCNGTAYPVSVDDLQVCMEISLIDESYDGDIRYSENCLVHGYNSCYVCDTGYFKHNGYCTEWAECGEVQFTKKLTFDNLIITLEDKNTCGEFVPVGIGHATPFETDLEGTFYVAISCPDGYVQSIDEQAFPIYEAKNKETTPVGRYAGVLCMSLDDVDLEFKGTNSRDGIKNCEYYTVIDGEFACIICEFGYTGKISGAVDTYDGEGWIESCDIKIAWDEDVDADYPDDPKCLNQSTISVYDYFDTATYLSSRYELGLFFHSCPRCTF